MAQTQATPVKERPLSPHIQVYDMLQITAVMSVMHRGTGIVLTFGLFVLAWWLLALASGPAAYETFRTAATHPIGMLALAGWSFALFYHTCAGIRHMVMDTGKLFTIPEIYKGGYVTIVAAILLTAGFWFAILR